MGNLGATAKQPSSRWDRERSTKADGKVGYWTREQVVAMDHNATVVLARHHRSRTGPELREMFAGIKARREAPEFASPTTKDMALVLTKLLADLPEDASDLSRLERERVDVETAIAIRKAVAAKYSMTPNDLDAACRHRTVVWPRQEAMYLVAKECATLSYPRMGRLFGGMHHTTVLHGVRKHADRNGLPRVREGVAA